MIRVQLVSVCVFLCFGLFSSAATSASESSLLDTFRQELEELKSITAANQLRADLEINQLKDQAKRSENEFNTYRANTRREIESLRAEVEEMKQKNQELQAGKRSFLANPYAEKPAFSAALSQHATNLGKYQTIIFDLLLSNDLGAYAPNTGVFTVPMNGTYFFTATVMSHDGELLQTEICLNGNTLVAVMSHDQLYKDQSSNSVVLALTTGDRVWVRHHNVAGMNAFGTDNHWSTFSGFMI